jgi:hypothetical protein
MLGHLIDEDPVMTITDPVKDVVNLVQRFQHSELFRRYVEQRTALVLPIALLMLATSLALAFGIIAYVGGTRPLTVLFSLLLAPLVLVGSLLVQGYLFLSWLEGRALARSLGHRVGKAPGRLAKWIARKLDAEMGNAPPVPWLLVAVFLALPLAALYLAAPPLAIAVALAHVAAPIAFARFDR